MLLLHRLVPLASPLGSVRGVTRMLVAIAAGAAISATVGPLSLLLGGVLTADSLPTVWRTWWLGDFSGGLVVLPLALAWWPPRPLAVRARIVEATVLLLALAGTGEITSRSEGPWAYLCFCALIWAALRFGTRGATLAIVIVVGFTVWNTMHYSGPFASHSPSVDVLGTQLFIAVAAISTLCLAAVVSERERIAEQLGVSRARVIETADNERRRIERNLHDGAQQRLLALAVRFELAGQQAACYPRADCRSPRECLGRATAGTRRIARARPRNPPQRALAPGPRRCGPEPGGALDGPDTAARAAVRPPRRERGG